MEREWMKRNHADRDNGCISGHLCRPMTENQMQPLFGCKRHRCDWPQEGPKLSFLYRSEWWRAWSQIIKLNWKKKKKKEFLLSLSEFEVWTVYLWWIEKELALGNVETVACIMVSGENFPVPKSAWLVTERQTLTYLFGLFYPLSLPGWWEVLKIEV